MAVGSHCETKTKPQGGARKQSLRQGCVMEGVCVQLAQSPNFVALLLVSVCLFPFEERDLFFAFVRQL